MFNVNNLPGIALCSLQVFDLGSDGKGMAYVACLTQDKITQKASYSARLVYSINHDFPSLFRRKIKTTYAPSISRSYALSSIQNKLGILALRYCDLNWISTLYFHVLL